jgi:hypothetical protein
MAKTVAVNVVGIHEETREPRWFRPGDTVPAEYQKPPSATPLSTAMVTTGSPTGRTPSSIEDDTRSLRTSTMDEEPSRSLSSRTTTRSSPTTTSGLSWPTEAFPVHGNKPDLIARLREDDAETA